jgi:SAM-dependent methyltransferase
VSTASKSNHKATAGRVLAKVERECDAAGYFNLQYYRYRLLLTEALRLKPAQSKVLDIGAAPGHLSMALARLGFQVWGQVHSLQEEYEQSGTQFEPFVVRAKRYGIQLAEGDIQSQPLPFDDNIFDLILFTEVLEHIWLFPNQILDEIRRVLKPDGFLLLTTPNAARLVSRLRHLAGHSTGAQLAEMVSLPVHLRHNREYTMSEVRALLSLCGLRVVATRYFHPHLLTQHMGGSRGERGLRPRSWRQVAKLATAPLILAVPPFQGSIYVAAQKQPGKGAVVES